MTVPAPSRSPLHDSPWFWVYLFTTFALIVMTMMLPRVQQRQAQIERKVQGRARAIENAAGQTPQTQLSTPEDTRIPLAPLFVILGAAWVVSCFMVWRRFRAAARSSQQHRSHDESAP